MITGCGQLATPFRSRRQTENRDDRRRPTTSNDVERRRQRTSDDDDDNDDDGDSDNDSDNNHKDADHDHEHKTIDDIAIPSHSQMAAPFGWRRRRRRRWRESLDDDEWEDAACDLSS